MRKWWKKLGFVAGCLAGLEAGHVPAVAQFGGPMPGQGYPGGGMVAPIPEPLGGPSSFGPALQQPANDPAGPVSLPNDGTPNGFDEWEDNYPWRHPVFWSGAQAMYGSTRRAPLDTPLLTTSTNPNVNTNVGAIGESSTVIPGVQNSIDLRHPLGLSATVGFSPTREWMIPFEVNFLYLHEQADAIATQSNILGSPLLARPILSTTPGQEGEKVYLSSFPGLAVGSVNVDSSLQVWGIDGRAVVRTGLQWGDDDHGLAIDLPMGVRYLNMNEVININSTATPTSSQFAVSFLGSQFGPGNQTVVTDVFKANNEFIGGEFGVKLESRWNRFFITLEPRVGVGATRQNIVINGVSVLEQPGQAAVSTPGGILALPSNGGGHTREVFTVLPEGTVNIGWDCFSWLRFQAGYNIIYWDNVVRAGDHINRAVDLRQVPTDFAYTPGVSGNNPFFSFKDSTFLIQGVSIGIVFSF